MTRLVGLAAIVASVAGALAAPAPAATMGSPRLAAVQVALRAKHLYNGTIDGLPGPGTTAALQQVGVAQDVLAGPDLGTRPLAPGAVGGDVTQLQFLLAWHGFPNSTIDGSFGAHVQAALLRFQRWAGLPAVGVVGPATVAALQAPVPSCPIPLAWPLHATISSPFGPRAAGFHPGLDLAAGPGTPVHAAAVGQVVFAGPTADGYGNLVIVRHTRGVTTMYAHLSRILATRGEWVTVGSLLGLVGATGEATGPHLHFEVRVRDAAVDPLPALR
jgi:murein DD-endopeptidase MepM/ murein hydrolase activator NlpD